MIARNHEVSLQSNDLDKYLRFYDTTEGKNLRSKILVHRKKVFVDSSIEKQRGINFVGGVHPALLFNFSGTKLSLYNSRYLAA